MTLYHQLAGPPNAPALLLGSSLGTSHAMWEPQIVALSKTRRVIAFDHRGHGGSPVPAGPYAMSDLGGDVIALMDELGLERASYVGISLGAMLGLWLAVHAPERIECLILIGGSAHVPPAAAWHERAATVREAGSTAVLAETVVERWFTPAYVREHPDVVERFRAMIAATPAEGYAGCCEAISGHDEREALPTITAPTLVMAGAEDPSIPPEHGRAIAAAVAGAHFQLIEPAAHLASVEQADAVIAAIADWLGTGA